MNPSDGLNSECLKPESVIQLKPLQLVTDDQDIDAMVSTLTQNIDVLNANMTMIVENYNLQTSCDGALILQLQTDAATMSGQIKPLHNFVGNMCKDIKELQDQLVQMNDRITDEQDKIQDSQIQHKQILESQMNKLQACIAEGETQRNETIKDAHNKLKEVDQKMECKCKDLNDAMERRLADHSESFTEVIHANNENVNAQLKGFKTHINVFAIEAFHKAHAEFMYSSDAQLGQIYTKLEELSSARLTMEEKIDKFSNDIMHLKQQLTSGILSAYFGVTETSKDAIKEVLKVFGNAS